MPEVAKNGVLIYDTSVKVAEPSRLSRAPGKVPRDMIIESSELR